MAIFNSYVSLPEGKCEKHIVYANVKHLYLTYLTSNMFTSNMNKYEKHMQMPSSKKHKKTRVNV